MLFELTSSSQRYKQLILPIFLFAEFKIFFFQKLAKFDYEPVWISLIKTYCQLYKYLQIFWAEWQICKYLQIFIAEGPICKFLQTKANFANICKSVKNDKK